MVSGNLNLNQREYEMEDLDVQTLNSNYDLNSFIGSATFTTVGGMYQKYIVSEGVKHLMTEANATWLVTDALAVHSIELTQKAGCRLVRCDVTVTDSKAQFTMANDDNEKVYEKDYSFTDLADGFYQFFIGWNGEGWTLYLPSEH